MTADVELLLPLEQTMHLLADAIEATDQPFVPRMLLKVILHLPQLVACLIMLFPLGSALAMECLKGGGLLFTQEALGTDAPLQLSQRLIDGAHLLQ